MTLSTRARGAQAGAPSGTMTSYCPPLLRTANGILTVIVLPSGLETVCIVTPQISLCQDGDRPPGAKPFRAQSDVHFRWVDVDAFHEKLNDARLFGRKELVPKRIQLFQCCTNVSLGYIIDFRSRCAPRGDKLVPQTPADDGGMLTG
jgi:hypothetical protein